MSIRTLVIGLYGMYIFLSMPVDGARAVRRDTVFRSGHRREVSRRSRGRALESAPEFRDRRANRSASSAATINAVTDLGIQQKRIGELRFVAATGTQAQVPHQLSADELQRGLVRASGVHVQRHSLRHQPTGDDRSSRGRPGCLVTNTTSSIAIAGLSGSSLS